MHPVRNRFVLGGLGGANDRRVSGTAAEVAGQLVVVIGFAIQVCRCHRDDEARRAEPTLRTVVFDHGLLHGMQCTVGTGYSFDGSDGFAMELREEENACVERLRTIVVCDHNSACTTVAFVAAFLRAAQAAFVTQPVQQRNRRRGVPHLNSLSVEKKRDLGHSITRRVTDLPGWPIHVRCGVERSPIPCWPRHRKPGIVHECKSLGV